MLFNDGLIAFQYRSYGTFFYHTIGSIISIGYLHITNIVESEKAVRMLLFKEIYL